MKTILVPVDFSFHSCEAAKYAMGLGRDLNLEVHLFHVSKIPAIPMSVASYGGTTELSGIDPLVKEIRHEAHASMKNLITDLHKESNEMGFDGPIRQTVTEGEPVEEILKWIKNHQPACLVLGVTPRSSLYRMFIGSVAGQLLQKVHLPVFAVPSGARYRGVERVVFASDFDPEDPSMFHTIDQLLQKKVENWFVVHMANDLEEHYFFDKEEKLKEKLQERWGEIAPKANVHTDILTEGTLLEGVETYAKNHDAGLVAFVMHRRNALGRLLDPSVSSEALFHMHLPMLFLHTQMISGTIW